MKYLLPILLLAGCAHHRKYGTIECVSADENNVIRCIGISQGNHTRASITFNADGTLASYTTYPFKPERDAVTVIGWSTEYDKFGSVKEQHQIQSPWMLDGTPAWTEDGKP